MSQNPKIDVHGMNSSEATRCVAINLREFNNMGYNEVFIVHGKGQGILREKIRSLLETLPYVKSFRPGKYGEGEDGVTVVKI